QACSASNERCPIAAHPLAETHPPQDCAGEPAAHGLAFPRDDRTRTLDRLHRGVEARKARAVEHRLAARVETEELLLAHAGHEAHVGLEVHACAREGLREPALEGFAECGRFAA